ncbi:hypothetical protein IJT93_02800 [bacterium]|nr:hypothetical protein [bacterium]
MKEFFGKLGRRWVIACEFVQFLAGRRLWLVPLVVALFCMILFVAFAQATHIAPFIYTLF